jgi:hypothetical protein
MTPYLSESTTPGARVLDRVISAIARHDGPSFDYLALSGRVWAPGWAEARIDSLSGKLD